MSMNKSLLKEYIRLLVENLLSEADPFGTTSSVSPSGTTASLSSTSTSSTGPTKSTEATGSGTKKTDDAIENLEAQVAKNNEAMKAINNASGKMFNAQKSANTATVQTQQGLNTASQASQKLSTPIKDPEEREKNQQQAGGEISTGLQQASAGVGKIATAHTLTQNALQNLIGATKPSS